MDFIKGFIPNLILLLAIVIDRVALVVQWLAAMVASLGLNLHMLLQTTMGKRLTVVKNTTLQTLHRLANANAVNKGKEIKVNPEDARLANIIKGTQMVPINLGKKNGDTKS